MIFKIDYLILYFLKSFLNDNYIDDAHEEIRALESKFGQKVLHELKILEALLITVCNE